MIETGPLVAWSTTFRLTTDPVSVDQLIAHAHALAKTTSAPVSSLLAPVDKAAATPWPNEAAMRQGLLFQLEGSMSGIGDVGVVGDGECRLARAILAWLLLSAFATVFAH